MSDTPTEYDEAVAVMNCPECDEDVDVPERLSEDWETDCPGCGSRLRGNVGHPEDGPSLATVQRSGEVVAALRASVARLTRERDALRLDLDAEKRLSVANTRRLFEYADRIEAVEGERDEARAGKTRALELLEAARADAGKACPYTHIAPSVADSLIDERDAALARLAEAEGLLNEILPLTVAHRRPACFAYDLGELGEGIDTCSDDTSIAEANWCAACRAEAFLARAALPPEAKAACGRCGGQKALPHFFTTEEDGYELRGCRWEPCPDCATPGGGGAR